MLFKRHHSQNDSPTLNILNLNLNIKSDPTEYIKLSLLLFISVFILKQLKQWSKRKPEKKLICDFLVFVINLIPKNENSEITEIHQKPKILKCEYVTSKTLEVLFK